MIEKDPLKQGLKWPSKVIFSLWGKFLSCEAISEQWPQKILWAQGKWPFWSASSQSGHFPCPVLPFLDLSVLPRKNLKFTKDFLSLPNPQNFWKRQRNYQNNQGNTLLKNNQGNPNIQGKEGQGVSRGKNRISQGVEDWCSLISVPYPERRKLTN